MKLIKILIVSLFLFSPIIKAQDGAVIFNARGQHTINDLLKNKNKKTTNSVRTPGDEYYDDKSFLLGSIFYDDKKMPEEYYLRYNAIKDIVETSQNGVSDYILSNKKISCTIWGEKYIYTDFSKGEKVKQGYLKLTHKGENFKIYERETIVYKKAKKAKTSLTLDIPAKFVKKNYFLIKKEGSKVVKSIPSKRKAFIKSFKKEHQKNIKTFLKKKKIDLKKSTDIIRVYNYNKTLN